MNHAQKWMRSALQVVVLLGVLGAGGAWGVEKNEILLEDKTGCKIYHVYLTDPRWMPLTYKILQLDGQCVNGFVSGSVIYGVDSIRPDGSRFAGLRAGVVSAGRFTGTRLNVFVNLSAFLVEEDGATMFKGDKQTPNYQLDTFLAAVADVTNKVPGSRPDILKPYLERVVQIWDQNSSQLFSQYTTGEGGALAVPQIRPDDPKVFGRSARGG